MKRGLEPRLDFLDLARSLAILGVMAVHTVQNYPTGLKALDAVLVFGQFGVQLFFAVSAYTMCVNLQGRHADDAHPTFAFWVRRITRIMVPMWAAMALYLAFHYSGSPFFASTRDDAWVIALTALQLNGLAPTAQSAIVPGGATIATEVLFYLVFPFIFQRRPGLRTLGALALAVICFDWLVFRPGLQALNQAWHFSDDPSLKQFLHYSLFKQFPLFAVGMALFVSRQDRGSPLRRADLAVWALVFLMALVASRYLALVAAACWLMLRLLMEVRVAPKALTWLGRHSYSLYLFHFAILNLLLEISSRWSWRPHFFLAFPLVVALSSLLAAFTLPTLEKAGIDLGRFIIRKLGFARPAHV